MFLFSHNSVQANFLQALGRATFSTVEFGFTQPAWLAPAATFLQHVCVVLPAATALGKAFFCICLVFFKRAFEPVRAKHKEGGVPSAYIVNRSSSAAGRAQCEVPGAVVAAAAAAAIALAIMRPCRICCQSTSLVSRPPNSRRQGAGGDAWTLGGYRTAPHPTRQAGWAASYPPCGCGML
jgi:hypothetical protein